MTYTRSTNAVTLYLNGTQDASGNMALTADNSGDWVMAGRSATANNDWFNGTLDEVLLINRSLSANEIYQLYLGGYNRTINGHWHRVAAADGIYTTAYNLTARREPAVQGYSQFKLLITGVLETAGATYTTLVGGPLSWIWKVPGSGDLVKSGTPFDWAWQASSPGSGRLTPQGTPFDWTWAAE